MRRLSSLIVVLAASLCLMAQTVVQAAPAEIEAFNSRLENAIRSMDNSQVMALWAIDGISLLPSTKPLVGKPAIAEFLTTVTAQLEGARMDQFEMHCSGIEVSGQWASEWCDERQVVLLPGGKPPFEGRGRMLLVLHKSENGIWLIKREMWNQAA
jgi:ketosteroid isomerase-like protein